MNNEAKILTVARKGSFGLDEQAVMGLLLVAVVIQVAGVLCASSNVVGNGERRSAAMVQMHDGTMLAKK